MADTIILGGTVIDPANNINELMDVALKDGAGHSLIPPHAAVGKVLALGKDFKTRFPDTAEVFDATGCLVTPGLIDLHVHVYDAFTPLVYATTLALAHCDRALWQITTALDEASQPVSSIVCRLSNYEQWLTQAVLGQRPSLDCASKTPVLSCTINTLHRYIINQQKTRILALLHIAMEGLAWGGLAGEGKWVIQP